MRGIPGKMPLGLFKIEFVVCCCRAESSEFLDSACALLFCISETFRCAYLSVLFWGNPRYVAGVLDLTVYPANACYVKKSFEILASVCAMSSSSCGFILMPVHQKQTTEAAVLKHRKHIEESLLKHKLSIANEIVLLFSKPDSNRNDGRCMSQMCLLAVFSNYKDSCPWQDSAAVAQSRIGPAPLVRIADMLGFDEASKPSASARVEQKLDMLSFFFKGC